MNVLTTLVPTLVGVLAAGTFAILMASAAYDRRQGFLSDPELHARQWHHEYLGALCILGSFALPHALGILATVLRWVGAAVMIDDDWEHAIQLGGKHGYKTALHRAYDRTLGRSKVFQRLNRFLDLLLGVKVHPTAPIVALGLLSPAVAPAQATCGPHCGTERWAVKALADRDTGVIIPTLVPTTVARLRSLHGPPRDSLPATHRYRGNATERTLYGVQVWLLGWKLEADSDLHLVIADPHDTSHTMIAEVPNPHCAVVCRSGHVSDIAGARAVILAALGRPRTYYRRLRPPRLVELVGVGFYDFIHGQTGVAPTGIELHPVLGIRFL